MKNKQTSKKRLLIILISGAIIISLVILSVCCINVINSNKKQTNNSNIIEFVDAQGIQHKLIINPKVPQIKYDKTKISHNGQDIIYEGDPKYRIRKGLDVSEWQEEINWDKVKNAGYEFVFIRIAYRGYGQEGKLKLDSKAKSYIKEAHNSGLDVGVYIFSQAINEEEAIEEANFVLDALNNTKLELPIVFDPESILYDEARTDNVSGEQFTKNAIAFCDTIKNNGYEPMIYSNLLWEAEVLDLSKLKDYPIWYADYTPIPQTPYNFEIWQYSESGKVDGIKCDVDLNVQFIKNK